MSCRYVVVRLAFEGRFGRFGLCLNALNRYAIICGSLQPWDAALLRRLVECYDLRRSVVSFGEESPTIVRESTAQARNDQDSSVSQSHILRIRSRTGKPDS